MAVASSVFRLHAMSTRGLQRTAFAVADADINAGRSFPCQLLQSLKESRQRECRMGWFGFPHLGIGGGCRWDAAIEERHCEMFCCNEAK